MTFYHVVRTVVYLLTVLVGNVTFRTTGTPDDVIFKEIGIKIEKVGKAVRLEDDILVSVFIQLPNLTSVADESPRRIQSITAEMHKECTADIDSSDKGKRQRAIEFQDTWDRIMRHYRTRAERFLRDRREVLKPFIVPLGDSDPTKTESDLENRRKRSGFFAFLGSSALTLLMGGITEVQIYKINKHLEENRNAINKLRQGMILQQTEIQQIKSQVIGFARELTTNVAYMFHRNSCSMFYNAIAMKIRHEFVDWTSEIDNILWTAIKGENSLLLTPRMLRLDMLRSIIEQNDALQDTIFEAEPSYMYSLAKMSLIEIDDGLNFAHMILIIPAVLEKDTVDLYQTSQVGTHIGGDSCVYYEVPNYLYKSDKNFMPISLTNCKVHNSLHVCPAENFYNESACIQENVNKCNVIKHKCAHFYSFAMSQVGILLRNNRDNSTFANDLLGMTSNVKLSRFRTAYLYWKDMSSVQVGNKRLISPNMKHTPLKMSNLTLDLPMLINYMNSDNVTSVFRKICNKYNSSLSNMITPAIEGWIRYTGNGIGTADWTWYIVITICAAGMIAWIAYLQVKIYKIQRSLSNDAFRHNFRGSYMQLGRTEVHRRSI